MFSRGADWRARVAWLSLLPTSPSLLSYTWKCLTELQLSTVLFPAASEPFVVDSNFAATSDRPPAESMSSSPLKPGRRLPTGIETPLLVPPEIKKYPAQGYSDSLLVLVRHPLSQLE